MSTNRSTITVHLGSEMSDPAEAAFLVKLQRDLAARGISASVVANFHTTGRSQRQIDFLVLTSARLTHVELKALSQAAPLSGSINGRWRQHLPSGRIRELDANPYTQAKAGTYALSDVLKAVVHRRGVPSLGPAPYKHIDTVVCIDPAIPPGSQLVKADYVVAIGYDELLDRLGNPGPRPPWDQAHWEQFLLELEVSLEDPASPAEMVRRAAGEVIADYCAEFAARRRDGLHDLIAVSGAEDPDAGLMDLVRHVAGGGSLALLGPSGSGKSHLAQHIAIRLAEHTAAVLWLRAGEYRPGHFAELVARGSAPFSALSWQEVLHAAELTAAPLVAILDGLNECPETLQSELLEQLTAFQLRHPCRTVITSTLKPNMTARLASRTVTLGAPTNEQRGELLRVYGAANPDRVSDAFQTPYELSIAAQCEADLPATATQADLFDRYIARLAPAETTHAGLRSVAWAMDSQLRRSLRRLDAVAVLGDRTGPGLSPVAIDQILACPLLDVGQGGVSFHHELIGRFLVAEEVVHQAATGQDLAALLQAPGHADLSYLALSIEHDPGRLADALDVLAEPRLFHAAATGMFGAAAAEYSRGAIRGALAEGAFAASNGSLHVIRNKERWPDGEWTGAKPLSHRERALLAAAGHLVADGLLVDEVCELLDQTDTLMASEAERFRHAGSVDPISPLLALTYAFGGHSEQVLACSNILEVYRGAGHWTKRPAAGHLVASLLEGSRDKSWARLYLALLMLHPDDQSHQQVFPELLVRAWAAGGYHLRLEALHAAQLFASTPDPEIRNRIGDFLEAIEPPDNWALSTTLVDALTSYGRLDCPRTVEDVIAELNRILAQPDDPTHQKLAAGAYQMQFENETAVGPYCEAIQALPDRDRIRLLLMAANAPEETWNGSWVLEELAGLAPTRDPGLDADLQQVFRKAAATVRETAPMVQEGIAIHLAGLRGWAAYAADPPPIPEPADGQLRAWRAVDRLILGLLRGTDGPYEAVWTEILDDCAADAVDVFHQLHFGTSMGRTQSIHYQLVQAFRYQTRRLLEWGLQHRSALTSHMRHLSSTDLDRYIITTLGTVGDEMTAAALFPYTSEPDLASAAVAAIREIRGA